MPASGFQLLNRQEAESIKQKSLAIRIMAARTGWQMRQRSKCQKSIKGRFLVRFARAGFGTRQSTKF
jgi:hypothetical protein